MRLDWSWPSLGRVLGRLGPTWRCSPVRRIIQSGCLLGFLWLLFYVCWPYTARPAGSHRGWMPLELEPQTGKVTVAAAQPLSDRLARCRLLHVVDDAAQDGGYLGAFKVISIGRQDVLLEPAQPLSRAQLEKLTASTGPWSLCEGEPGAWPSHYADDLRAKAKLPANLLLMLDPLLSISTALAARAWVWSLCWAAAILLVCLLIPRGFCGYLCPLGTLLDLFDWAVTRRLTRFRPLGRGWWVHLKYHLLLATLAAAALGVLISGFVSAIAVVTRGLVFLVAPLQTGLGRGWHQVPPVGPGQLLSLGLFLAILGLGVFGPRFWCKYVCPTGAVFSLGNIVRIDERKVGAECIGCNRCVEVCPFDAIQPDFATRTLDCTFCQTCGGACPTRAIHFTPRWSRADRDLAGGTQSSASPDPASPRQPGDCPNFHSSENGTVPLPNTAAADKRPPALVRTRRRGFLTAAAAALSAMLGGGTAIAARSLGPRWSDPGRPLPVRPPGSVPEEQFLQLCIRCGECFRACPNDVLQPLGFQQGLEGLWTPQVVADWSGCEASCNNCGQVCPTGAIRPLPLEEKRVARIGWAVVNRNTCLPHAGRGECQLCVDECTAAGYRAIEFVHVGTQVDAAGGPIEDTGFLAPAVLPEKCVGCGLCQTRCRGINVVQKQLLAASAIVVEAGEGKEDRLLRGSYIALRQEEERQRAAQRQQRLKTPSSRNDYLPEF